MIQGMTRSDFIEDHISLLYIDKNGKVQINQNVDKDIDYYGKLYDDMIKYEKEGKEYEINSKREI